MQQDIQILQCCDDRPMSLPSWVKLGPRTPKKALSPLPKIARRKRAKSSITQPWIIRFRSYSVEFKRMIPVMLLKNQGQEVKGQGHGAT